jgi:peptidoglycan/LPS O-acetylase OafA/YrhL
MTMAALEAIEGKRTYHTLDGMRGIAALAVVSRHFTREIFPIELPGSYLAVDLFFAMSGFVLALSYDDRLGSSLSAADFIRRRLIRLYPLYLISILIVALGIAIALTTGISVNWTAASLASSIALSLLFLPTPPALNNTGLLFPLNQPAWSLFMEIAVNVLYALARPLLTARGLALTLLVSGTAFWPGDCVARHGRHGHRMVDARQHAAARPVLLLSGRRFVPLEPGGHVCPACGVPAWLVLVLMLGLFAVPVTGAARTIFDMAAVFVLLPALLIAGIQNQPKHFTALFTFLGVTSYPIYILHVPLQKYIGNAVGKIFGEDVTTWAPAIGLAILAVMLPIGWVAHRYYDAPVRAMVERVLKRSRI